MSSSALMAVALAVASAGDFWAGSRWLSVPNAPEASEADRKASLSAPGTSWFVRPFVNRADLRKATWTVTGLGVFEAYVNGRPVGADFLKPGFTTWNRTKYAFTYDVTDLMGTGRGVTNWLSAEVSSGWWRDQIVRYAGRKSAFRGVLEVEWADGSAERIVTDETSWRAGVGGPVVRAGIFDGETFDARVARPFRGDDGFGRPEANEEFAGEILPSAGGEVTLRRDLALRRGPYVLRKGETLVVDFGQNHSGVPEFVFSAAAGTTLTCLPGEMLNDADAGVRGCDGPKGSVYRANLRIPETGMRLVYTFAGGGVERYLPRFTFFGYRYLSLTATDEVRIESVTSLPVTSVTAAMESGRIETGVADVNRLVLNVRWGQLSNYLSVPTDCPQRNERLGWAGDTQVFGEAGAYLARTAPFLRKWLRDLRDNQSEDGGFTSTAPVAQSYGRDAFMFGSADAGVIVPWTLWRMFGDRQILEEHYEAMARFVRRLDETRYDFEKRLGYIYADWLSFETFESHGNKFGHFGNWKYHPHAIAYRRFLAACYWLYDAGLMARMAEALGRDSDADFFRGSENRALSHIRATYLEEDGLLLRPMRHLQTACVFALRFGIVTGRAREGTKALLLKSIREHGDCLQTGFLGTSLLMDTLTEVGAADVAYTLLLQRKCPSWLYSVDQGATTVWERWDSYTRERGFGPVGMNSFNHYAYGGPVLAWLFKTAAGIAPDASAPGFARIAMAPRPDRRLGFVRAAYDSAAGTVRSAWRYEGDEWIWEFTVPEGAVAAVTVPGEEVSAEYRPGAYCVRRPAESVRERPRRRPPELNPVFRDGLVLAAGKPVRVFGPGEGDVRVTFRGETRTAKGGSDGWLVEFPSSEAGGPYELAVELDGRRTVLGDVRVGEVWLMAGQSNMQMKLRATTTPREAWRDEPRLRMHALPFLEGTGVHVPGWTASTRENAGGWSALGWLFGCERLASGAGCVGTVNCFQGASSIRSWMPPRTVRDVRFTLPDEVLHRDHFDPCYSRWNAPGQLYEGTFRSIVPFSFTGVVWYQGESNTGPGEGALYAEELAEMIRDWRRDLRDESLPFLVVEIADYDHRDDRDWHGIQGCQRWVPNIVPNVVTVRSADICESNDIHPRTKDRLAKRLSKSYNVTKWEKRK